MADQFYYCSEAAGRHGADACVKPCSGRNTYPVCDKCLLVANCVEKVERQQCREPQRSYLMRYQDDLRQMVADLQSDHDLLQQGYLCHWI